MMSPIPHFASLHAVPSLLVTGAGKNSQMGAGAPPFVPPMAPSLSPLPAIGFEAPDGLRIAAKPGARSARVVLGCQVTTPYGELVLLQQTPPILFDARRLETENAFASWRDWELAAALLPERDTESDLAGEGAEYYDMRDIAGAVGMVSTYSMSRHAKDLWPNYEGNYRLNFTDATRLIKRYLIAGTRRFAREELEFLLRQKLQNLVETVCPSIGQSAGV